MAGIVCVIFVAVAIAGGLFAMGSFVDSRRPNTLRTRLFIISKPTIQFLGVSAPR